MRAFSFIGDRYWSIVVYIVLDRVHVILTIEKTNTSRLRNGLSSKIRQYRVIFIDLSNSDEITWSVSLLIEFYFKTLRLQYSDSICSLSYIYIYIYIYNILERWNLNIRQYQGFRLWLDPDSYLYLWGVYQGVVIQSYIPQLW